uniref:Pyrrolocin cluster transcription factor fsdR n=1 Tax=Fungal sp. (strain NRRL 50135) TaxID=1547289 RepID=PRLR_FUNXX|nr:RecName: Full=Pyrrolocin cluster transcription factor fsdR; AltName: Full=Pyrrolocin biosynthesis protein R [fungal sp. NRRL 50135]AIP87509.1 putative Zn2Cys6 transcription factor [fungal sp. NRRL 50135]
MSDAVTPCSSAKVPSVQEFITTSSDTQTDRPRPPLSRRRDKPQLSCNACRRRKVRCDRLHPCSNCSSRGHGSSCEYAPTTPTTGTAASTITEKPPLPGPLHGTASNMQNRIDQLESLVLGLMHQHQTGPSSRASPLEEPPPRPITPDQRAASPSVTGSDRILTFAPETQRDVSPTPSDYGSIRIQQTGVSYVSSSHWAAILGSIADLRSHFAQEDEAHSRSASHVQPPTAFPKPQLLYSSLVNETPASIVKSVPPRPVVDRLLSRYFNVLDIAPAYVRQQYEEFWKAPHAAPIMWVGLLFSMMCLSTQLQQALLGLNKPSPTLGHSRRPSQAAESQETVESYKEKAIQCLILGHYTKGGPYVLETLILYFLVECFHLKDMEVGVWMLVGNIVQVAILMGYHRDADHFPNISPFAGEMRRRVWAMIVQLDFSISTQLGLPRLVKESQTDTAEPRNLHDSDFDELTTELPTSRPETEVTPTLYVLAKLRLLSVGVKVADVATEPRPHSYAEVLELDHQINEARSALPSSLKWSGLGSSLNVPSQIIIQRIWLEVIAQQLKIVLHRKFLEPSRLQQHYGSSRSACLTAAMKILQLQRLVDEETQADGLLYQSRWRVSSAFINDFLLATSILCFCLQSHADEQKDTNRTSKDAEAAPVDIEEIRQLLNTSLVIWSRQCASSREARRAVAALRYVLGDSGIRSEPHPSEDVLSAPVPAAAISYFPGFSDLMTEYDLPSLGLEPTIEGTTWPVFTTNLNNNIDHWAGVTGFQQMDLSS